MPDETIDIEEVQPDAANVRKRTERSSEAIRRSLQQFGAGRSIVMDSAGIVRAGNGTLAEAKAAGIKRVRIIETDGDELVAVRRRDLTGADAAAYAIADNRAAELSEWDEAGLDAMLQELANEGVDLEDVGFTEDDLAELFAEVDAAGGSGRGTGEGVAEPPPEEPVSKEGDLWLLGRHRVLCGDSTQAEQIAKLMGGKVIDAIVTDPPYCSGGFQEAGRASGSIGSKRIDAEGKEFQPRIHNDALSSRGYCALMKAVISAWHPPFVYMFTDWRMWVQLFDVMESSGCGVRNMIVWDKGTPGMGRGWRSQHELVMFGAAAKPEFDNHKAVGNVITVPRTGNPDHPTQKPEEVIDAILGVTDFCEVIGDPFLGSGTTLVAAEKAGRTCYGMEIDPGFCDVVVRRWEDVTGEKAQLDG